MRHSLLIVFLVAGILEGKVTENGCSFSERKTGCAENKNTEVVHERFGSTEGLAGRKKRDAIRSLAFPSQGQTVSLQSAVPYAHGRPRDANNQGIHASGTGIHPGGTIPSTPGFPNFPTSHQPFGKTNLDHVLLVASDESESVEDLSLLDFGAILPQPQLIPLTPSRVFILPQRRPVTPTFKPSIPGSPTLTRYSPPSPSNPVSKSPSSSPPPISTGGLGLASASGVSSPPSGLCPGTCMFRIGDNQRCETDFTCLGNRLALRTRKPTSDNPNT